LAIHAEGCAAHQAFDRRGIEAVCQQFKVGAPLVVVAQVLRKTGSGLVGQRMEVMEDDAKVPLQRFPVIQLQFGLRRWQLGAEEIVNQVERQARAIARGIEPLQRSDAFLDTITALPVDVLGGIAGQGGDDFHLVMRHILGQLQSRVR